VKDALSLATFTAAALCFGIFLVAVKPDTPILVQSANTESCKTRGCDLNLLAEMSKEVSQLR